MDLTLYEMPGLAIITILVMGLAIWLVLKLRQRRAWVPNLDGKHVLITGGSSGIGKSVALAAARFGADVSIVSRDSMKLFEAGQEIMEVRKNDNQLVTCMVGDVSDSIKLERALIVIMDKVEKEIDILVTCAGFAICGTFEEVPTKDVNNMIQTNLIGTMNALRLVIPMMKARKSGNIVLVGSQASLIGLYGYSAYACTKFAIRGLAESLQMEMKPFNIQVTLCLPPDTDTPGFEAENDSKPEITKKISSAGGLVDPDTVANTLLKDTLVCLTYF